MKIYLSIGSNVGDRLLNLHRAVNKIGHHSNIVVTAVSSVYESEPVGFVDQPWFLNAIVEVETSLEPLALLRFVKGIEQEMGRQKQVHWGPRNIDIDIVLYDNWIVNDPILTIPHAEMHRRKFVLLPLAEIAADTFHPAQNKTINQLLKECPDDQVIWHTNFYRAENRENH